MGVLKVTSEQLISTSSDLAKGCTDVEGQLSTLRKRIEPLATDWEGAAQSEFQRLWQEWDTGAKQVREALDGISQLLKAAGETYAQAEDAVRKSMSH